MSVNPRPRPQVVSHEAWDNMTPEQREVLVKRWVTENNCMCDKHKADRAARIR